MTLTVRDEQAGDIPAVRELNTLAFPTSVEANLVDALREEAHSIISLVAVDDRSIVGVGFQPRQVQVFEAEADQRVDGLTHVAVAPVLATENVTDLGTPVVP